MAGVQAQEDTALFRAVTAEPSVESFRPVGDARTWIYYAQQKTFGRLTSIVKDQREVNGRPALVFDEDLSIDYTLIGANQKVQTKGDFLIAPNGAYLGCDLAIGPDSASEQLKVELDGHRLEGYYTRAGSKVGVDVPFEHDQLPWEMYFIDQLEVFLAMHDLKVGDTLEDSVFSPQIMMSSRIKGTVTRWMWQEIYKDKIDSVFIIRLTEPGNYQLYFTADKRLVRVDMEDLNVRVYQGMIRNAISKGQAATSTTPPKRDAKTIFRLMFFRSPHYVAFFLMALTAVVFFTQAGFRRLDSWLALLVGGLAFSLVPYTQIPLQIYVVGSWMIPHISDGGSIYFWSIFPAAAGGVFQTLYLLVLLIAVFFWRRIRPFHRVAVGAFLGAGFGIIEACYVSGLQITSLFTPILAERGFMILFHVVAGTLIGAAIGRGTERLSITLVLVAFVNSALRYIPIFVQQEKLTVPLMTIIMGFIILAFLVYALLTLRSGQSETAQ